MGIVPFQILSMLIDHVIGITVIPVTQTINVLIVVAMVYATRLKFLYGVQKIANVKI